MSTSRGEKSVQTRADDFNAVVVKCQGGSAFGGWVLQIGPFRPCRHKSCSRHCSARRNGRQVCCW